MTIQIFNGKLTTSFQPTQAYMLVGETAVFDFDLVVANIAVPGTPARVEWYAEYTSADPNAVATKWYRELAEEDIGNGDVRMPVVVRRFSTNGGDAPLSEGTYAFDAQFTRKHNFVRLQVRVAPAGADNCTLRVNVPFGTAPLSP